MPDWDDGPELEQVPSKSELKRQMTALQQLGESLLALSRKQLATIPISDERLLAALHEAQRIQSRSARRRHLQYIGKLMRTIDAEPIRAALHALGVQHQAEVDTFHHLEILRDDILAAGLPGVELALQQLPGADRQHLRQLVLQHQREFKKNKPPAASRKLFKYLREVSAAQGD